MQETEEKKENEMKEDSNSTVYELGYLLVPTIKEEDVAGVYTSLKDAVSSFGGMAILDEMPKMIPLAYTMSKVVSNIRSKFNTAYFGWMKFTMSRESILNLKKKLDLDPNLIRFLILKTVKENTVASKRFTRPELHRKPKTEKTGEAEVAQPINKEEIDKEIDALVAN